jgi:hypothetical protein
MADNIRAAADGPAPRKGDIDALSEWLGWGPSFRMAREYCGPLENETIGYLHGLTEDECRAFLHFVACAIYE